MNSNLKKIFRENADKINGMSEEKFVEVVSTMFNKRIGSSFLPKCNRVEVIDNTGRAYTNYNCKSVEKQMQDDDKTLKIFIR